MEVQCIVMTFKLIHNAHEQKLTVRLVSSFMYMYYLNTTLIMFPTRCIYHLHVLLLDSDRAGLTDFLEGETNWGNASEAGFSVRSARTNKTNKTTRSKATVKTQRSIREYCFVSQLVCHINLCPFNSLNIDLISTCLVIDGTLDRTPVENCAARCTL